MANKNNNSNFKLQNSCSSSKEQGSTFNSENESKIASQYKNVEPLPESFRPRRDGPGGEDGE